MSYERINPAPPLGPPPSSTERLITSDRTGQANKTQCEGAGGIYTEQCPSMAQVGITGPKPAGFSMPCVSYCEMPSGARASTAERPGTQWDPGLQQLWGYGASPEPSTGRKVAAVGAGVVAWALATSLFMDAAGALTDEGRRLGYRWTAKRPWQGWVSALVHGAGVYAGYRVGRYIWQG